MRTRPGGCRSVACTTLLAAVFGLALGGCKKDAPAPAPEAPGAAPASSTERGGQADYQESSFAVAIRPTAPLEVGKPGVVEIRLDARGGYHMNETYPYRFRTKPSEGLKFATPVVEKSAMQLEPASGTMKVEVTPESAGDKSVSGVFSFSVCSADRCLVEKRELRTIVAVN